MNRISFIAEIAQIVIAVGTIFIFNQIYLYRRNYKAETVKQLFQTFFTSSKLNEFSISISMALKGINESNHKDNNQTRKHLIKELCHLQSQMSENAFLYSKFLGYIYYSINNKLINPIDVAGISGEWIKDYYLIKRYIEKQHSNDFPHELISVYWPEMPKRLEKAIGYNTDVLEAKM